MVAMMVEGWCWEKAKIISFVAMSFSHGTLVSPLAKLHRWNEVFLVAFTYLYEGEKNSEKQSHWLSFAKKLQMGQKFSLKAHFWYKKEIFQPKN